MRTEDSINKARGAFQRAILDDSDYAPAYAGLAEAYVLCACQGRRQASLMTKAKDAALHALELDENLAEAHAALGFVLMSYDYDWAAANRELKRAVALNPNSAEARLFYGDFLVDTGRFSEGIGEMHQAVTLDPLSPSVNASLGLALYHARDNEAAIEQFQNTLVMDPNNGGAIIGLGLAFLQASNYDQAAAQFQRAITLGEAVTLSTAHLAQTYALMGDRDEARQTADQITRLSGPNAPPAYALALVYTALAEKSTALDWLVRAYQAREADICRLEVDPSLDPLRGDPRFQALVHRVGIP
jgi:Tfp pilus assembly protein PilF